MNEIEFNQPLLTLSMIVKNEEKVLERCLKSIENIADEIVIIDTGSIDSTLEIANNYKSKIGTFNWINDYGAARNESLKLATGKWILYLDADEELADESKLKILDLINTAPDSCGGFICSIESVYLNDNGKFVAHNGKYTRLFRNIGYPRLHFFGRVHEQIAPSLIENNYFFLPSDLKIIHSGYSVSHEEMQIKVKRNLEYLTTHVNEEPENGYAWYQLGNSLAQMNIVDQALEALINSLKCKNLTPFLSANTALSIAQIETKSNNINLVIEWCDIALKYLENHIPALNMKANAQMKLGNPEDAKMNFETIYELIKSGKKPGYELEIPEADLINNINAAQRQILLKVIK